MGEVAESYLRDDLPLYLPSETPEKTPPPTPPLPPPGAAQANDGGEFMPDEGWLPITESRKGNVYSAVFHLLCSGIGVQALVLPVAFAYLGWAWGLVTLSLAFIWQLYTIWLLVDLHESPSGLRRSRFLRLSMLAFGPKLGKLLAMFPVLYLSGGSCVILIITGGGTLELFLKVICDDGGSCNADALNGTLWFLVFTCVAVVLAQLPNLNSIAFVSLAGAITAVAYYALILGLSLGKVRPPGVSYQPSKMADSDGERINGVLNAVGFIALVFRGHNVVLEIQGSLTSNEMHPSKKTMWRGVKISYTLIALLFYSLSIGGYWAYGNQIKDIDPLLKTYKVVQQIPGYGGILTALTIFHGHAIPKIIRVLIYLLILINSLCSYQIFAMPTFDNWEFIYTNFTRKRASRRARICLRLVFGGLTFFVAVAFPFLAKLASLIGGIALPLTFAYPCIMWVRLKKDRKNGAIFRFNLGLGCLGILLSSIVVAAAAWRIADKGFYANFFKPE